MNENKNNIKIYISRFQKKSSYTSAETYVSPKRRALIHKNGDQFNVIKTFSKPNNTYEYNHTLS
jgi:hypothetical protein